MPTGIKSVDTGNNSTCSAPATLARKSATSFDRLTKAELIEKTREFICRVENFVYLCARRIDTIVSQCTYALRLYKALPFVHICLRSCVGSPKLDKATPFLLPIHNYNF